MEVNSKISSFQVFKSPHLPCSLPCDCCHQDAGLQAISDLEASLRGFSKRLETGDGDRVKQEVPDMQQDALTYVGRIEEAMVQGFPFKVPERVCKPATAQGEEFCPSL